MVGLKGWDYVLLAISGYVAVVVLVRLMRQRRDGLIRMLIQQAERAKRQRAGRQGSAEAGKPRQLKQQRKVA
jgi:heme exporter protein D